MSLPPPTSLLVDVVVVGHLLGFGYTDGFSADSRVHTLFFWIRLIKFPRNHAAKSTVMLT